MSSGIFRAFSTVGGWTMASRILGFVRDMLMSRILGAGPIADAFQTAFLLPNLFRRFLAEGAFNSAFIPQFKKKLESGDEAAQFAQNAFSFLLLTLITLIALIQIFMPLAIIALTSGFLDNLSDGRFDMSKNFSRITIFYILFMSLSALCSGILNSFNRFAIAAAAPVLLNVVLIITLCSVYFLDIHGATIGVWLSWGVFIGGIAQLSLLYYGVRNSGINLQIKRPHWNADLKYLLIIALPATAAAGVAQINLVIGRQIASWESGAVSWLSYADRVYQLPLGVIGVAVGVVLLPTLSAFVKSGDEQQAQQRFNEAIAFSMLFTIPASVAIFVIATPIVSVVFEGGQFSHDDTLATAQALTIYAIGLPAFVLQKTLMPLFFARENTKTPLHYAIISLIINTVFAIGFMHSLGYMAPVWGSVISAWAMVFMLWRGSRKYGASGIITPSNIKTIAIFIGVSILMGAMVWLAARWLAPLFAITGVKWLALLSLVFGAMVFYFVLVMRLSGISLQDLRTMSLR